MEFEPWMLLVFPLFFGMGWLAARIDIKELLTESSALPRSYFQGLNFLLNEQQDQAIEAFIEVVKVDPQTVELHFALGSLFRRRGEVDRAIRMHLNLVERADLEEDKKQQALFELAQDYLKAGILDRAETAVPRIARYTLRKTGLGFPAGDISERKRLAQGHRYQPASDGADRRVARQGSGILLLRIGGERTCSQADRCGSGASGTGTAASIRKAVRATIMLGDIELAAGNASRAIEIWKRSSSRMRNICRWWPNVCCRPIARAAMKRRAWHCCRPGCKNILRWI